MNIQVEKLNIFFIFLSALLAYFFPIELFLLAYAIMGPLHYVTEINWLHQKNYFFSSSKWTWLILASLCALMLFIPHLGFTYWSNNSILNSIAKGVQEWSNSVLFFCLFLAFANQFLNGRVKRMLGILVGLFGLLYFRQYHAYNLLLGALLPTFIHVYLFTLLFMLYGAIKSNNSWGKISVILALFVPVIYVFLPNSFMSYSIHESWLQTYSENGFYLISKSLAQALNLEAGFEHKTFQVPELKLMMFVAFMYLYHYLNWFSKTSIIKWNKNLDKKKGTLIIAIWGLSLLLYIYNFRLGFLASLFLSFLHVVLEFPLNMMSLKALLQKK